MARASIDSAMALLPCGDVEVVVSDNSGDEQKADYYSAVQREGFHYLRSSASNPYENWRNAIDYSESEFILMLGDDDILAPLPGFRLPLINDLGEGQIGLRPAFAMFSAGQGVYRPTCFSVRGASAVDRLQDYLVKNGGANISLYSIFRREILQSLSSGYLAHHPTLAGYIDWPMMLGLISTGELGVESNLVYLYNNANWDSAEKIRASTDHGMTRVGLPKEASQIEMALWAVDTFVAICRKDSPVPAEEKLDGGLLGCSVYFNSLIASLQKQFESKDLANSRVLRTAKLALASNQPVEQLLACVVIIEMWLPQLREPYQKFFDNVLDPAIAKAVGLAGN